MRRPALVFGGFIAHALNDRYFAISPGGSELLIDAATVLDQLLEMLGRDEDDSVSVSGHHRYQKYLSTMLYYSQYSDRMSPMEAADKYFEATLDRPMFLSATVLKTAAHRVFELLCQRAGGDWATAELVRRPGDVSKVRPLRVPHEWNEVVQRLGTCDHSVSQSNAATTKREEHGPLVLICGAAEVLVPEEMSLWQAICLGPRRVRYLAPGSEFEVIKSAIANAMQSLNRNIQEILSLGHGLCPFDWLDLPVNQIRGVGAFLKAVKQFGGQDVTRTWEQAWAISPVPGFRNDLDAFRSSDLGQALRMQRQKTTRNDFDRVGVDDEGFAGDSAADLCSAAQQGDESPREEDTDDGVMIMLDDFESCLRERLAEGRINRLEADLLRQVYQDESLDDLCREPKFALIFAGKPRTEVVAELARRLESE